MADAPEKLPAGGNVLWKPCLALLVVLLVLDHATKLLAIAYLKPDWWGVSNPTLEMWEQRERFVIIPQLLQFQYAENRGAAFSILYGHTFLLGIVSAAATCLLVWFWRSLPATERIGRFSVAAILSGAIGNMIDRFFRGYVVDFIDAHWFYQAHWPTFNIADSAICVGAFLVGLQVVRGKI